MRDRVSIQYELESLVIEEGGGFVLRRTADGQRLAWHSLPVGDGLQAVNVVGTKHRREALRSNAFSPGKPVCLVPEPDNSYDPNAIAV